VVVVVFVEGRRVELSWLVEMVVKEEVEVEALVGAVLDKLTLIPSHPFRLTTWRY